jgi:hypothetical protein
MSGIKKGNWSVWANGRSIWIRICVDALMYKLRNLR